MSDSKAGSVTSISDGRVDSMAEMVKDDAPREGQGSRFYVYFLSCFATLGGFLFGYDTGIVSGSMLLINPYFSLTTVWTEAIVSATIAAAAFFSIVAGVSTDFLGRKKTIMLASFVFSIGAVVMGAARGKEVLLVGRIIVGMGIGFASMTVPVYVAEAAPPTIRGRLVTLNQLFITIGIVVSALVAGAFSFLKPEGWRYMLGLAGVPGVIQFVGFFFLPESPRWLVDKGRIDEARKVLQKIRSTDNVQMELQEIQDNIEMDRRNSPGGSALGRIFKTPHVRKALFIGGGLQLFQQLCGINTVIYYSGSIIKMAGFPSKFAIWLVMVPNTVNFLATFIGIWLVEKLGRKILTVASFAAVVIALIVLAVGFQLSAVYTPTISKNTTELTDNGTVIQDKCATYSLCEGCINNKKCGYCFHENSADSGGSCLAPSQIEKQKEINSEYGRCNDTDNSDFTYAVGYCPTDYAWMAILGLTLFLLGFAPGLGPMPWTINSEIFPLWARGTCIAMTTAVNWVCNLIVSFTFLTLTETITKYGTFWLFGGICFLGMLFTLVFVPETKGKTLEEVEMLFMTPEKREERRAQSQQSAEKYVYSNTKM
ncbi:proton myo-inositol cotransporter-like [Haliotis cracherodii]|uniref:proton myo-inositol cotransporter-like n=1 Tax=Haliotis cracherodii TaxID=6455 RepID=UPI0039ED7175